MKIGFFLVSSLMVMIWLSVMSEAKIIRPSAEQGENKIYIRADGLACYFCAYGMERFFKQSGNIAWYDMKMKEGVVEIGFIKGKPILSILTLKRYVHDAGFSAREIRAEFAGRVRRNSDGSYYFQVTETGQEVPIDFNRVMREAETDLSEEIVLFGLAKEEPGALMRLVPVEIRPRGAGP